MRYFILPLAVFIFASIVWAADTVLENVEYEVLETPLDSEQHSVIEAFSFLCVHCYTHHKQATLAETKSKLPTLAYKIYPLKDVPFGGEFAQMYAYAEAQDSLQKRDFTMRDSLTHKLTDAYFVAIFEKRERWSDAQSFYKLGLDTLQISKKELDAFMATSDAQTLYNNYDKASVIANQYGGTPAFLVAGKYIIKMENIKSLQHFISTISILAQK